jgi:hypothetical protein
MNDPTKEKTCTNCQGEGYEYPYSSECCGATMLNWPDNDICPDCGEHTGIQECEYCGGTGQMNETEQDCYKAEQEYIKADTYHKRRNGE